MISTALLPNWFIEKIFQSPPKYFEAIQNGGKSKKMFETLTSLMKLLVADKCKQCEIYRRFYDVFREVCSSLTLR